jgi:hypothetical protein
MEAVRREGRKFLSIAIYCRKSEIKISLAHEQSVLFACRIVGLSFQRHLRDDKNPRENSLLRISCNPLISIDSDERIQGNPRKSNSEKPWFL